jgi:antitoxin VapB
MRTAKLFQNGRSQAVRLPREFRFEGGEVYIKKTANGVLLTQKDPWVLFAEGVQEISADFMAERDQPEIQDRDFDL